MKAQGIFEFFLVEVMILAFMAGCTEDSLCSSADVQRVIVFNQTSCIKHAVVRGGQRPLRPQESQRWHARKPETRKKPRAESWISRNSRIFFELRIFPRFLLLPTRVRRFAARTSAVSAITCGKRSIRENMTVGGSCQRFIIPPPPQIRCLSASCHLTPTQRPGGLQRDHSRTCYLTRVAVTFLPSCGTSGVFMRKHVGQGKTRECLWSILTGRGNRDWGKYSRNVFPRLFSILSRLPSSGFLSSRDEWTLTEQAHLFSKPSTRRDPSLLSGVFTMQRWSSLCLFVSLLVWIDLTVACDVSAAVAAADGPHIEDELRAFMFDFAVQ